MLINYFLIIILSLFTLRFILSLFVEDKKQNNFFKLSFCTFVSAFYLFSLLVILSQKIDSMHLPTLIPLYLSIHLIMLLIMSVVFFYIIFLIHLLFYGTKSNFIIDLFSTLIEISIRLIKKIPFLYNLCAKILNFLNILFNPFLYFKNIGKINNYKLIKLFFLISYIISGLILLSPITNSYEVMLTSEFSNFTRDYELYKTVFVTSLIPFTLTYLSNFKLKYKED